jgi:hypothetical protein
MVQDFSFRSSLDGFTSSLASMSISAAEQTPANQFIKCLFSKLCFRDSFLDFMVGEVQSANGTFSINEFAFNGAVICTTLPTIKTVQQTVLNGSIELNNLPADSKWDLYQNDV